MCVVYSSHANVEGVQDIGILPYARRGSELSKPYIRCDPSILVYQESLLNRIIGPQEVYKTVWEKKNRCPKNQKQRTKDKFEFNKQR